MKFGMTLFLLATAPALHAGEWMWQHPLPQGNSLWKTAFYNEAYGYAVGDYGTIMFSVDGGISWELQYEAITDNFRDIHVLTPTTAWIAGDNGMILHTTNGGMQWTEQVSSTSNGLNGIVFVDALNGWSCGDQRTIRRTTNGGGTWYQQTLPTGGGSSSVNDIFFVSLTEGWAVGTGGIIWHTTDGGAIWTVQFTAGATGQQVKFITASTGFVVGVSGSIHRTTNAGASWTQIPSGTSAGLSDIAFLNSTEFWIAADNGLLLRSTNAGTNWTTNQLQTYASLHGLAKSGESLVVVGEFGALGRKTNTQPWALTSRGENLAANWITFSDANNGFAVGQDGLIMHTVNGGETWSGLQNGLTLDSFYGAEMIGTNKLWVVGDLGVLLHTSNAGASWVQQSTFTFNTLFSISFVNENAGWAVGDFGTFIRTANGGITWTAVSTGLSDVLFGVKFKDTNNGWMVGENGLIRRTVNGGTSWTPQTSNTTAALFYVDFTDLNNGFCAGSNGTILKTTNGGAVWTPLITGTQRNIYLVSGVSMNSVWAIGDSGLVLHSTNGGLTWPAEFPKTEYDIFGLMVLGDSLAWISGDNGCILRNGGSVSTISVNVSLTDGWNMISNPVDRTSNTDSVRQLYPNSVYPFAYGFNPGTGYGQSPRLVKGMGYWGKFAAGEVTTITGTPLTSTVINVSAGWNMVGSISYPVDTSAIISIPAGNRLSLWYGYTSGYFAAGQLVPGGAYWVKVENDGQFVFSSRMSAYPEVMPTADMLEPMNQLSIRDMRGGNQKLFFGTFAGEAWTLDNFEMPPPPPSGGFDVRFNTRRGGSLVQTHGDSIVSTPISIQSESYPIIVDWKIKQRKYSYALTGGTAKASFTIALLADSGAISIADSTLTELRLLTRPAEELPGSFALFQNYPNPFNATTTVMFTLPVLSTVDLSVYNILGQRVRTLIQEERHAGRYSMEWDGRGDPGQMLGSAVYFVVFTATGTDGSSFKQAYKTVLLK